MWDWFTTSFERDPAGWISVFIALAAIILGGVFWRTTWTILKAIGRVLRAIIRGIASIRITTARNLKTRPGEFVIEPRWVIGRTRECGPNELALYNSADGSSATHVRLESLTTRAQIISGAQWPNVPGGRGVKFTYRATDGTLWPGVHFNVTWKDHNGHERSHSWLHEF